MRKFIQQKLKDQKGLTLIELLAVIVILAIIAAIAIPAIGNIIENSRVGAIKSDATNIINAVEIYESEGGKGGSQFSATATDLDAAGTVSLATLKYEGYIEDAGGFEGTTDEEKAVVITLSTSTFTGSGTVGGVTVAFTGADKASIAGLKNSQGNTATAINLVPGPGTVLVSGR